MIAGLKMGCGSKLGLGLQRPAKAGRTLVMLVTAAVLCISGCSAQDRKSMSSKKAEYLLGVNSKMKTLKSVASRKEATL